MKVLHVIPSVSLAHGGPSQVIRTMTRGLAELGLDVHVATTDDDGSGPRLQVPLGEPIVQEGEVTYWYFRRSTLFYKASWPMTRWLAQHTKDYDLVHIHALFSYTPAAAAHYAFHQRVPYIVRPLGVLNRWGITQGKPLLKRVSLALLEGRIIRHAARMHYTSAAEREEAESLGFSTPAVVIPNPVQGPLVQLSRRHFPGLEGRPVLLFLSRINRKKGLDLLLNAFARLRQNHPTAGLVIAGSGDDALASDLREQAKRLGISGDVHWTGFVSGTAKWEAFASADVFVLPSYSENFGVAPVEAMLAAVPVVVSDQVGIHPEVTASGAGLVVPCDAASLAKAFELILRDPAAAQHMREAGLAYAKQNYSVRAVSQAIYRAYESVLQESGTTGA